MNETALFALASAAHAGFQVTVTTLVYPALADVGDAGWQAAHARHSRRIVPLVVVLYAAVVASGAALLLDGPDGPGVAGWVGLAGGAGALLVTATLAAPTHGRLGARDDALVRRLLGVDRLRCACAVVGAVGAAVALG